MIPNLIEMTPSLRSPGLIPAIFAAGAMALGQGTALAQSRHEEYTKAAARGSHMEVTAATFFGTADGEAFVGGGTLPDGSILAAGNLTGPAVPTADRTLVVGTGKRLDLDPFLYKEKADKYRANGEFNPDIPGLAGFFVVFDSKLSKARQLVRFDWGVASVSAVRMAADGKAVILAGRATPEFRKLDKVNLVPTGDDKWTYGESELPADVFIARLGFDGKIQWAHVLEGAGNPPRKLFTDDSGHFYLPAGGLHLVSPDGREIRRISDRVDGGEAHWLAAHPTDGLVYFGGDRNTFTNKEPWRQPFLIEHDLKGTVLNRWWEANPKEVGSDAGSLESDSSVRGVAFRPDGKAVVIGWSDGGNSIFGRQVADWRKEGVGEAGLGMSPWGMKSANSLGHVMLVDLPKGETLVHAWFAAYLPMNFVDERARNAPNHASFGDIELLPGGGIATWGGAASGLVQTPGAFYHDPCDGEKYGGNFLTVFDPTVSRLMFSSYLPGAGEPTLVAHPRGLLVFSRSRADDGKPAPSSMPVTPSAVQGKFAGAGDGHVMLLEAPAGN